jgi:hypothetical protein
MGASAHGFRITGRACPERSRRDARATVMVVGFEGGHVDAFRPEVVAKIWISLLIVFTKESLSWRR